MSTGAIVTIFDRPRRSCGSCFYWSSHLKKSDNGYLESICVKDDDEREHKLKRASDYCSMWKKSSGADVPAALIISF